MNKKSIVILGVVVAFCIGVLSGFLLNMNKVSVNEEKAVKIENKAVEIDSVAYKCDMIEKEIQEEYGDFDVYTSTELTEDTENARYKNLLENRMNSEKVIVERTKGTVLNGNMDGEAEGYYISYRSVPDAQPGDEVITYLVYNPATNYIDDIIERYDVVIK